jgi:hypothetical protein
MCKSSIFGLVLGKHTIDRMRFKERSTELAKNTIRYEDKITSPVDGFIADFNVGEPEGANL